MAYGNPMPEIHWQISEMDLSVPSNTDGLYDEVGIINESFITNINIDNMTTLSTLSLTTVEVGKYICIASNSLGSLNASALLTIGRFFHTACKRLHYTNL